MLPVTYQELPSILANPALSRDDRETLAASEVWQVDLGWSREAPFLRQLAMTSPGKMTPGLARETITHLRVVDKQVRINAMEQALGSSTQ